MPGSGYVPETGPAFVLRYEQYRDYCGLLGVVGFVPFRC
jgi:hypothetical protein